MKIYIGNLHHHASGRELYDLFITFGNVLLIDLHVDDDGRSCGYAYVYMKERNEGELAILKLNGINFMNQFLHIFEIKETK